MLISLVEPRHLRTGDGPMLSVLRNRTYRHLFAAQVVALVGTGLTTVALALLAYDTAGAMAGRMPRRALMVATDLTRAGVALALPFVTRAWQIYLAVLLLQAASAAFTPAFQATVPRVLPAERDYTGALSMS